MTASVPTIGAQLRAVAERQHDAVAITCGEQTITWGDLERSSNRLAREYQRRGVEAGSYVSIALPNSIEMVVAMLATWKAGAVPQPLSTRLPESEFQELLRLVPRALLVGREDPEGKVPALPPGFVPDAGVSDGPLPELVSPVWKAMPSGGSTGRPKLIEATVDSRLDPDALGDLLGMTTCDSQLLASPLTHNTPFAAATMAILLGQHLVLMPRFDAREYLRLIDRHHVQYLSTVPTIMQRCLAVYREDPDAYDLSSIRRMWHMAAPCPDAVKRAWIDILGPDVVCELYGGTELQAMTLLDGNEWLAHPGSVGRVRIGQIRILDENGAECPSGQVGEIYMRPAEGDGPSYRYIGSVASARDGWETIGDLGWFDDDGYLYLSDRRVDMFQVGGRNVYPAEVENALGEHPDVLSCLVVGVPDDDLGQVPYALVQVSEGSAVDADQLRAHLSERIAGYKLPRVLEFRDVPLRDDAGKARRSAVRAEIVAKMRVHGAN
ncbi:AMP-binding protein [Nocardioides sp. LHD-245]|uniref:AMP-binding protein n=1 Tax=Nocardioides sp. LHD-245 TaxID=3051387 RepID=UPI0027DF386C|nr:AMP-binding protein [Nocardioides sp. LHD-245]